MKKRISLLLAVVLVVALFATGCGKDKKANQFSDDGKVVNIYAWNEEYKGFFEKYFTAQVPYKVDDDGTEHYFDKAPGKKYIDAGIKFNWVINKSDDGVYQQKLDEALNKQFDVAADEKVDIFLAEADYIIKYANANATLDISKIGVTDMSQTYEYTVKACSDDKGVVKGVSFQACPSALIYRRSIAKDVLGSDDPATVQAALSDWTKFNAVAKTAKEKGYYMTASFAETYRTFSNNVTSAWVDKKNNLVIDANIENWIKQTEEFSKNAYTLPSAGIWDAEKNAQMFADGKTMCFFGPAWYFNFCMGNAQDKEKGCYGDWAITMGPQAHFWGGTWILAANGTDNSTIVADVMKAFTVDTNVMTALLEVEGQFPNHKQIVKKFAEDPNYGNAFLGGQNDVAMFASMTDSIKWEYHTIYDQLLNEKLQTYLQDYFKSLDPSFTGEKVSKETAMNNYYNYVKTTYPNIKTK